MKRLKFLQTLPGLLAIPAVCEALGALRPEYRPTSITFEELVRRMDVFDQTAQGRFFAALARHSERI